MLVFPALHTPRLTLRQITVDDVPALLQYADNKKISDNVLNIPYPYREPDAVFRIGYVVQGFKQKARFVFAIVLKERGEMIGEIGLHYTDQDKKTAQLGYWIGEPFWGQGIATEAAQAVVQFGFNRLELDQVFATCYEDNGASERVLQKAGMEKTGSSGRVLNYRLLR